LVQACRKDPDKVVKVMETTIRSQDPDWFRNVALVKAKEEAERICAQRARQ